jgi:hypothetical protein
LTTSMNSSCCCPSSGGAAAIGMPHRSGTNGTL